MPKSAVRFLAALRDRARSRWRAERLSRAQHLPHDLRRDGADRNRGIRVGLLAVRTGNSRAGCDGTAGCRVACDGVDGGTRRRRRARADRYDERRDIRTLAPDDGARASRVRLQRLPDLPRAVFDSRDLRLVRVQRGDLDGDGALDGVAVSASHARRFPSCRLLAGAGGHPTRDRRGRILAGGFSR